MNAAATLLRRLRYMLRLRTHHAELVEEIAFHEDAKRREFEAAGFPAGEAAAASRRAMGNVTLMREDARAVWLKPWFESALQDVAYALRGLLRQPGFSIVALATLGVAIGLNTSVFTAFNGVFWHPWPVSNPATVFEATTIRSGRERHSDFSLAEFRYLAQHARPTVDVTGMACTDGFYPGCDIWLDGAQLRPAYVSANTFQAFGVSMERGRGFIPADDQDATPVPVVILSYDVWQRRFAGEPGIVGRHIHLDAMVFTVVGVAGRGMAGTSLIPTDVWLPLASLSLVRKRDAAAHADHLQLAVRLAPGVTRERARSELDAMTHALRAQHPVLAQERGTTRVELVPTSLDPNPMKRRMAYAVFGLLLLGSALVVLLACANVANLHLARAAARGREIAVRVSLGASRRRVLRQLLTESLVLAAAASALGMVIAFVAPTYLLRLIAADAISTQAVPDLKVFSYATALTLLACVAFGLMPALHATKTSAGTALKGEYGLAGVKLSLRQTFLAVQVAVSVIALCGAGLLLRGLTRATHQDFGFSVSDVAAVSVELPASQDSAALATFARSLTSGVLGGSSTNVVGATTATPFGNRDNVFVLLPGQDSSAGRYFQLLAVSPGYFDVLRIPRAAGRMFVASDTAGAADAVLVNEALAARLWPGRNAVGQTLIIGTPRQVVGVMRDADTEGVASEEGSVRPKIYEPFGRAGTADVPSFVVRSASPESMRAITALSARLAPDARVRTTSVSESLERHLEELRSNALLAAMLGAVALVLVSIGIFGVFAYVVQQRTREIGIRMALGAQRTDVVRVIIQSSSRAILIGLIAGLAGAVGESFVIRGYLFGLSPLDPVAYLAVIAILGIAAVFAVYLPALRATRITPIVALRVE